MSDHELNPSTFAVRVAASTGPPLAAGALAGFADEITGMLTELAIKNPLKNAILGRDLGTLDDVGGLSGIWDRLTGANANEAPSIGSVGHSVSAMNVTASSVIINGGGTSSIAGSGGAAGGLRGTGGLNGPASVQEKAWRFFESKGLKPHQIAGILGNISAESAFNPLARGDGGDAYGLFQHNDRAPKLLNHLGGVGNLGDVEGQLQFAWEELLTTEKRALEKLMASTNVTEATEAFVGFERPQGWTPQNPQGALHFDRRLGAAQDALDKFGNQAVSATQDLGTMGEGMGVFGNALGGLLNGQSLGDVGGGLLNGLLEKGITGLAGVIGLPGFQTAGFTGHADPSKVAGFVHGQEYVFGAADTARIGVANLEALRKSGGKGYRTGGFVSSMPAAANRAAEPRGSEAAGVSFTLNDYSGQNIEFEEKQTASGGRHVVATIGAQVAAALKQPVYEMGRAFEQKYRLKPGGNRR